jgi:hypothetical protein
MTSYDQRAIHSTKKPNTSPSGVVALALSQNAIPSQRQRISVYRRHSCLTLKRHVPSFLIQQKSLMQSHLHTLTEGRTAQSTLLALD